MVSPTSQASGSSSVLFNVDTLTILFIISKTTIDPIRRFFLLFILTIFVLFIISKDYNWNNPGAFGAMAEERKSDFAQIVLR